MDKIQAAIAKARAEREARAIPSSDAPPRPPRAPGATHAGSIRAKSSSRADVEAAWQDLPVLSLKASRMERNRIVTFKGGSNAAGMDMMRTRVLQQMRANKWRRLAITSPGNACGKSTISLNLAFSLSRQRDLRTLLLEVDLRRPSLAAMLGMGRDINFARVLEGSEPFEANARRCAENLVISTNSGPWRNPSELLNGPDVSRILADIEARYDPSVIIFDMPPVLAADDAMAFARQTDCVLLVAAAETTTVKEIDMCERELAAQTNVMGVILNKCRYIGPEYGYSYYD